MRPLRGVDLVAGLLTALLCVGCGVSYDEVAAPEPTPQAGYCRIPAAEVEARIDDLLPRMTLEEKVAMMAGTSGADGMWPTSRNDRLGIPGLIMVDGPRGVSAAAGHATAFPVGMARAATWDPSLEERVGEAIGIETRAMGGNVILAPTVNVLRHPRWGRAQETYGEDPLVLGRMAVGFIRGAQRHVLASVKHFAVNSIDDTRNFIDVTIDERTLREIYLPHFRAAVQEAQVGSVMSAYNMVNGQYCAENTHLLHDILKEEWGFEGFVESDWHLGTRSTVPSVLAGLDIEMPKPIYFDERLIAAVESGAVPEANIDAAVRRILRAQFCFELDTKPPQKDPTLVESPEHTGLALEVARRSIVLLKNDAASLPLDRSRVRSLAVVGKLADQGNIGDNGSSRVDPSYIVTPLQGIQNHAGPVNMVAVPTDVLSDEDRAAVRAADAAVVVVGLVAADEGEANDRERLGLSSKQEQLIAEVSVLNDRTIVVLEGGSAILVEAWIDAVPAVMMAWYPGQEGGNAIAEVLFGDVNPSAKLPIVFPRAEADLPPFPYRPLAITYGYYHGYRLLDRNGTKPRFPLGFGLGYTEYRYSNLEVARPVLSREESFRVSVDVTNTGARAGREIAQLYVSYRGSAVDRPVKDLRGFASVPLAAGETKRLSFELPVKDLAYYDVDVARWTTEAIRYVVQVGPSSADLPLSTEIEVRD